MPEMMHPMQTETERRDAAVRIVDAAMDSVETTIPLHTAHALAQTIESALHLAYLQGQHDGMEHVSAMIDAACATSP